MRAKRFIAITIPYLLRSIESPKPKAGNKSFSKTQSLDTSRIGQQVSRYEYIRPSRWSTLLGALYGNQVDGRMALSLPKMLAVRIDFADSKNVWQVRLADLLAGMWSRVIAD